MNIKAYIGAHRDFPKAGIVFRDIAPLIASPEAFGAVVKDIAASWRGRIDSIAALDARGFVFGAPAALELNVPFRMIRKRGKLPGETISVSYGLEYGTDVIEMQCGVIAPGERVLIVDDLLATGGTAAAACSLVEQCGGVVSGVSCVVEIEGLGGREKLKSYDVRVLAAYNDEE